MCYSLGTSRRLLLAGAGMPPRAPRKQDSGHPARLRPSPAPAQRAVPAPDSTRSAERPLAVVTGPTAGIGRVFAERLAERGHDLLLVSRDAARLQALAVELAARHAVHAEVAAHDLTDPAGVEALALALAARPRVDVLVNNAGFGDADDLLEIDEARWDNEVALNLKATFLCVKAVLPGMIDRGSGVIVNIASVNGMAFFANEPYSAAKAGMINLTQSIAVRYGQHGIRANAIAPGTIRSPLWDERIRKEPAIFERLVKWYPLGRVGEPDDVAKAALFLASDDAAWISGSVLRVDGGLLAGNAPMARELVADFSPDPE